MKKILLATLLISVCSQVTAKTYHCHVDKRTGEYVNCRTDEALLSEREAIGKFTTEPVSIPAKTQQPSPETIVDGIFSPFAQVGRALNKAISGFNK